MPGRDGTGPMGAGAMTGRGLGGCASASANGQFPVYGIGCQRRAGRGGEGGGHGAGHAVLVQAANGPVGFLGELQGGHSAIVARIAFEGIGPALAAEFREEVLRRADEVRVRLFNQDGGLAGRERFAQGEAEFAHFCAIQQYAIRLQIHPIIETYLPDFAIHRQIQIVLPIERIAVSRALRFADHIRCSPAVTVLDLLADAPDPLRFFAVVPHEIFGHHQLTIGADSTVNIDHELAFQRAAAILKHAPTTGIALKIGKQVKLRFKRGVIFNLHVAAPAYHE